MAFANNKQEELLELIDDATSEYLDVYIRSSLKSIAKVEMNKASATAQDVADAIFDEILLRYSGDITMALACKQIFPKTCLPALRNDIIKFLNS